MTADHTHSSDQEAAFEAYMHSGAVHQDTCFRDVWDAACAWLAAQQPAPHADDLSECVPVPKNADQAAMMCLLGESWLRDNAPERLKSAPQGELVGWLRDQRGEHEGPETLDPLFVLGKSRPSGLHGATYSPLSAPQAEVPKETEAILTIAQLSKLTGRKMLDLMQECLRCGISVPTANQPFDALPLLCMLATPAQAGAEGAEAFEAHIMTTAWYRVLSASKAQGEEVASTFRMCRMAAQAAWDASASLTDEVKHYSDGTTAAGPAPLPELSPRQQDDTLCPKCGSEEWDRITDRTSPGASFNRCNRCENEWMPTAPAGALAEPEGATWEQEQERFFSMLDDEETDTLSQGAAGAEGAALLKEVLAESCNAEGETVLSVDHYRRLHALMNTLQHGEDRKLGEGS